MSLAGAIWSASSGMRALIHGLDIAYDERETRKFVALRAKALALTVGNLALTLALLVALLAAPSALGHGAARTTMSILRWPVLALAVVAALAVIYPFGPDRDHPEWRWVSWGGVVATGLWLAGSAAFALYSASVARFDRTDGALGGVIALLIWLWLTSMAVLVGASVNAEMEHQTEHDTTSGDEQPQGERGARMADEIGARSPR